MRRSNSPFRQSRIPQLEPGDTVSKPVTGLPWPLNGFGNNHWGIYVGGDEVVHVGGANGDKIVIEKLNSWGVEKILNPHRGGTSSESRQRSVNAAKMSVGKGWDYEPLHNNCQHFVSWCQSGVFDSPETNCPSGGTRELYFTSERADSGYGAGGGALTGFIFGGPIGAIVGAAAGSAVGGTVGGVRRRPRFTS